MFGFVENSFDRLVVPVLFTVEQGEQRGWFVGGAELALRGLSRYIFHARDPALVVDVDFEIPGTEIVLGPGIGSQNERHQGKC